MLILSSKDCCASETPLGGRSCSQLLDLTCCREPRHIELGTQKLAMFTSDDLQGIATPCRR